MREKMIELLRKASENNYLMHYDLSDLCDSWSGCAERMADYLLDNGVVMLPCKIGETVYSVENVWNGRKTEKKVVTRIIDRIAGNELNPLYMVSTNPYEIHYLPSEFGKTVFLSKEEAEKALERSNHK